MCIYIFMRVHVRIGNLTRIYSQSIYIRVKFRSIYIYSRVLNSNIVVLNIVIGQNIYF